MKELMQFHLVGDCRFDMPGKLADLRAYRRYTLESMQSTKSHSRETTEERSTREVADRGCLESYRIREYGYLRSNAPAAPFSTLH